MPPRTTDERLDLARRLRRDMTHAEAMLWRGLRGRGTGAKFRRQVPIGPYVADFACVASKLIVELDGAAHDDSERQAADRDRETWLARHGWRTLRFHNDLVTGGGDLVIERIAAMLSESPHPTSLRKATFSRGTGEVAQS